ncbi:7577_t:CDS:2, partial [Dentiscutata erythropus]
TQPNGRKQHTATLIPDGKIIFIGGVNNLDVAQLDIYDTIADQWSQKSATISGSVFSRWGHTATLTTNNRSIIMYGGQSYNSVPIGSIAILDLTTYVWTNTTPSGDPDDMPIISPSFHTAALYNDYVFFTFGKH